MTLIRIVGEILGRQPQEFLIHRLARFGKRQLILDQPEQPAQVSMLQAQQKKCISHLNARLAGICGAWLPPYWRSCGLRLRARMTGAGSRGNSDKYLPTARLI
jgi:hypothetical protein